MASTSAEVLLVSYPCAECEVAAEASLSARLYGSAPPGVKATGAHESSLAASSLAASAPTCLTSEGRGECMKRQMFRVIHRYSDGMTAEARTAFLAALRVDIYESHRAPPAACTMPVPGSGGALTCVEHADCACHCEPIKGGKTAGGVAYSRLWADVPGWTQGNRIVMRADDVLDNLGTENLLAHEMGHAVMNLAMTKGQHARLRALWRSAREPGSPWADADASAYALHTAQEFWAEGSQCYLGHTSRGDILAGVFTPEELAARDPPLYALLREVYGPPPAPDYAPLPH